jgi:polyisoprenoid-binding protein YceI
VCGADSVASAARVGIAMAWLSAVGPAAAGEPAAPARAAPAPSAAAPGAWSADASNGTLTFRAMQAGAEFEGRFTRFAARLEFVPGDRPTGRFDVTISTASVDTAERERDDLLRAAEFFDAARVPEARYLATAFVRVGPDAYEARGRLTLRGVTRDVPLRFTWSGTASRPLLDGSAVVRRLEFGVGQGDWRDTAWIGGDVRIAFALRPVPATPARAPT